MKAFSAVAATDRGALKIIRDLLHCRPVYFCLILLMLSCARVFAASMQQTVADCTGIVRDFTRIPEHAIPRRVLRNAKGVAILRVLKGAFGVSGRLGEGVVMARLPGGGWSGPSAIATGGGGFGFQIGGEVTEFVIILNTQAAVDAFARGGNVQFGGALSAAAGPVGRTAEAGVLPAAAVYTYSRSQGLFAGASLEGTGIVAHNVIRMRAITGAPQHRNRSCVVEYLPLQALGRLLTLSAAIEYRVGKGLRFAVEKTTEGQ